MSERYGMADGRCITNFDSSRILNDTLMAQKNIQFQDNYKYRAYLQTVGPEGLSLPLKNSACMSGRPTPLAEQQ